MRKRLHLKNTFVYYNASSTYHHQVRSGAENNGGAVKNVQFRGPNSRDIVVVIGMVEKSG